MRWTFSRLEAFNTCPLKFYHIHVAKDVPDPPGTAAIWGTRVHEALEARIRDNTPLPTGMDQWEPLAKKIENIEGRKLCEVKLAVDSAWQPTSWDAAWCRGLADLLVLSGTKAVVLDYKTGRRKLTDQVSLYALKTFSHYPEIEVVHTRFVWLKERAIDSDVFTRDQCESLQGVFLPQVERLEKAYDQGKWPPKPSGLCRKHCPVGRIRCSFCGS